MTAASRVSFAAIAAILLPLAACTSQPTGAPQETPPTVSDGEIVFPAAAPQLRSLITAPVESAQPREVHLYGRITWDGDCTVHIYSPVQGRVTSVKVGIGDEVKRGDVLAELVSPDYDQAVADQRASQSNFIVAEKALNRSKDLRTHGAAAEKDVETAQNAYDLAEGERRRTAAKADLLGGKDGAGAYRIRSPIDGVIVRRTLSPGQEVRPDQQLANVPQIVEAPFTVTDSHNKWVILDVPDADLAHMRAGLHFNLSVPGDGIIAGTIALRMPEIDPDTRIAHARGVFADPAGLLNADQYVNCAVTLPEEGKDLLQVPAKAIFMDGDHAWAFVQEGQGRYRRHAVTVLREDGKTVTVSSGLKVADAVVVDGALLLNELVAGSAGG